MVLSLTFQRVMRVSILALTFFLIFQVSGFAAKRDKQKEYVMTEIELQSELMSYADRFGSIISQAYEDFEKLKPSPQARQLILNKLVRSKAAMYTIAAEPNPHVALLDMVAVTTLGRMIYQENMLRRYGKSTVVLSSGFQKLEKDIWQIAAKVLTKTQQDELRQLILLWRKNNPESVVYNYLRFGDFAAQRRNSTLVKKVQSGGVFKTVKEASQQAEEIRMVAERGIYLGTRLPLLMGDFSEVWMAQTILNPEAQKVLADFHTFSTVSERLTTVAEQLPKHVAAERSAAINQFMIRFRDERKGMLADLLAEEQRIKDLVSELRQTLTEGNNLLQSASTLSEKLNLDFSKYAEQPVDSKPFDIKAYQATAAEVSKTVEKLTTLVETTNQLLDTGGLQKLLPEFIMAIDKVESEGEELVDHSFQQAFLLILIAMGAYIIARLIYNYLNIRLIESRT